MEVLKKYIINILVAIDQLFNAILFGDRDETISSRLGKWKSEPPNTFRHKFAHFICPIISFVFFDKLHCIESIEEDEGGDAIIRKREDD